ncbi:MAG: CoA pyrophosphatase [Wenzhouxiangellaceae bacterium]|nr:CoA pyrophosphatase [Wenzhouxiangellaceae bacterium]
MSGSAPRADRGKSDFSSRLTACLHPLETHVSELPVWGFCPAQAGRLRPAAVLIAVTDESRPRILLTKRAAHLSLHAGQVAFPGGAREPADASVLATALRETREETGIAEQSISPVGYLARYDTISAYRMTAVVGLLDRDYRARPDHAEVEAIFSVPLEQVIDASRYTAERLRYEGRTFEVLTLEHPEHRIWGATAALLHEFGKACRSLSW